MTTAEIAASAEAAPEIDRLATQIEARRAAAKDLRDRADRILAGVPELEERLLGLLAADSGEVAVAHNSGRVAFAETGFLGPAAVNEEGIRRHADTLAGTGLEPQEVTVTTYPRVTAIRDAEKDLRALGIDVRELLDEAAQGPVLRWRKAAPRSHS